MNQGVFFGQLVIGPAGSGKSTYCKHMQQMAQTLRRNIIICNLDPAAEYNEYTCDIDIKQLITLEDVMEEMELGPNGGLFFCIEYLLQNQTWLQEKLSEIIKEDDYVLFDCPGQIELYSDQDVFRELVKLLQNYGTSFNNLGFSLISMYMMDVNFIIQQGKFLSGILQALSAQIALELPSTTVLTKCDLLQDQSKIQKYTKYFSPQQYQSDQQPQPNNQLTPQQKLQTRNLMIQIKKIVNTNDIVSIRSLNLSDEDSIRDLLIEADFAIQYGENIEPDDKAYEQAEKALNNNNGMNMNFDDGM